MILLAISTCLFPTVVPAQKSKETSLDFPKYHQRLNEAYGHLSFEEFAPALDSIDSLIQWGSYLGVKDAFIAAQIAVAINAPERAFPYLLFAVEGGTDIKMIKENLWLKKLQNQKWWAGFESNGYLKARRRYLTQIDLALLQEFSNRYEKEQESKGNQKYSQIVRNNFDRIAEITRSKGFPGVLTIGVDDRHLSPGIEPDNLGNSKVIATLQHQPYAFSSLREELFTALENGQISPRDFAYVYVFEKQKVSVLYGTSSPDRLQDTFYFNLSFEHYHENINEVNQSRMRIGLVPYETEMRLKEVSRKWKIDFYLP